MRNCTAPLYSRLDKADDFDIYITDNLWVVRIEGFYEFHYHPRSFIGRIPVDAMPKAVVDRLLRDFAHIDRESLLMRRATARLRVTDIPSSNIDGMGGNLFYAHGQRMATYQGQFYIAEQFTNGYLRSCATRDIDGALAYVMLRMECETDTWRYVGSILDFSLFCDIDMEGVPYYPYLTVDRWDASRWAADFDVARKRGVTDRLRSMRRRVFAHTVASVLDGGYDTDGTAYRFDQESDLRMRVGTKFYDTEFSVGTVPVRPEGTVVEVVDCDCLLAARRLAEEGYNPAVLNMANRTTPGGGVLSGAGAQEENLFRRTNLFRSLYQFAPYAFDYGVAKSSSQYPMDRNFGGVYTPGVTVFRGLESDGYPLLSDPYMVSVISVAAMNRPRLTPENTIAPGLIEGVKNKIRTILRIGLDNGHDALVLGAFGCGAFCNPPAHVARLFREVLAEDEFRDRYRRIAFAIIEDHNSGHRHNPRGNYLPFVEEFCG